jgi:hypothetical protein
LKIGDKVVARVFGGRRVEGFVSSFREAEPFFEYKEYGRDYVYRIASEDGNFIARELDLELVEEA